MKVATLSQRNYLALRICAIFSFSILMVISAYVRIPLFFTPVPFTLQTFVFYLSIVFLKRQAVFSQAIYLFLGLIGLPVFTNAGSGLLYFLGPTGGYLVGFVVASLIFPFFSPKLDSFFKNFCYFSSVAFCVYFFGIAWLMFIHKFSLTNALIAGAMPFALGEVFKIGSASLIRLRLKSGLFSGKNGYRNYQI
ncbi:MAG: biotin transporter BioY [Candidatus Omnitrophica bacterium]|jgi:biotin transport system substrate-specific component|nr:biotin transporter BioY [Candidatus Omnitrophota bacterium]